jgi:hypothetical protein
MRRLTCKEHDDGCIIDCKPANAQHPVVSLQSNDEVHACYSKTFMQCLCLLVCASGLNHTARLPCALSAQIPRHTDLQNVTEGEIWLTISAILCGHSVVGVCHRAGIAGKHAEEHGVVCSAPVGARNAIEVSVTDAG